MNIHAPQLKTRRLVLNEIQETDAELIVKWRSNPKVYKYFFSPHSVTIEEHLEWYRQSYMFDSNRFDFMASLKENNVPIGVFGIRKIEADVHSAEVSYIVDPQMQGKGYATEAIIVLHNYIKEMWHCKTAVAGIHKNNLRSIKFAENLGYKCIEKEGCFLRFEKEI